MKGDLIMKKFLLIISAIAIGIPAFSTCPINGEVCAFTISPSDSLQDKYLPNKVENIQKPNAFRPQYVKPYYDEMINTDKNTASNIKKSNDYNSNCQFGVCLPGVQSGEE